MKIFTLAASHRPESLNKKLVLAAADMIRVFDPKIEVEFAEYARFDMPIYNDMLADNPPVAALDLAGTIKDVDGIIIASPEYNWSFPGSLKNIIDWLSKMQGCPLAGKTVLLMSATTGMRGGIVGLQQLKTPLEALSMFVFNKVFPLGEAHNAFDDAGGIADEKKRELLFSIVRDYTEFTAKMRG